MDGIPTHVKNMERLRKAANNKITTRKNQPANTISIRKELSKIYEQSTKFSLDPQESLYSSHSCRGETVITCLFSNVALKNNEIYYFQDPARAQLDSNFNITVLRRAVSSDVKRVPYRLATLLKMPDCDLDLNGLDMLFSKYVEMLDFGIFVPDMLYVLPDNCVDTFDVAINGKPRMHWFLDLASSSTYASPLFLTQNPYSNPSWGYDFNEQMKTHYETETLVFTNLLVQYGDSREPSPIHWSNFRKMYLEHWNIMDDPPFDQQVLFVGSRGLRGIVNMDAVLQDFESLQNVTVAEFDLGLPLVDQLAFMSNATVLVITEPLEDYIFQFLHPYTVLVTIDTWSYESNSSVPIPSIQPKYVSFEHHLRYELSGTEPIMPSFDNEPSYKHMATYCQVTPHTSYFKSQEKTKQEKDCLSRAFSRVNLDREAFATTITKALRLAKKTCHIESWTDPQLPLPIN
jgi:hypothetical protein